MLEKAACGWQFFLLNFNVFHFGIALIEYHKIHTSKAHSSVVFIPKFTELGNHDHSKLQNAFIIPKEMLCLQPLPCLPLAPPSPGRHCSTACPLHWPPLYVLDRITLEAIVWAWLFTLSISSRDSRWCCNEGCIRDT